ncbi:hypothetical protein CY34DRAFT_811707, partial [Suillus luteus UH-Slu-Lm8-n1]
MPVHYIVCGKHADSGTDGHDPNLVVSRTCHFQFLIFPNGGKYPADQAIMIRPRRWGSRKCKEIEDVRDL